MTTHSAAGVTRNLTYGWIEFGHTGDGRAFTAGLDAIGWKNIVRHLPRKTDSAGSYFQDAAHPILPIRWKGSSRLILPNAVRDTYEWSDTTPWINDPLLNEFRNANGEEAFREEVKKYCSFLSRWIFSPGVVKKSDTEAELTLEGGPTDYADLVALSGHGTSGTIWGGDGGLGCEPVDHLRQFGAPSHTDRLKYVLIPTCYNLSQWLASKWLSVFRRTHPLHGLLGYAESYPGGDIGAATFAKFAANLKAGGGTKPILEAYKEAHTGYLAERWGAILHVASKGDTMRDWIAGRLAKPDAGGEVRWFNHENWPDGEAVTEEQPPYRAGFGMQDGTRIDATNNRRDEVGLFPGDEGTLEIAPASGPVDSTERFVVNFYYYRPDKDGMDLDKLIQTRGSTDEYELTVLRDENKEDKTTHADALSIKIKKEGLSLVRIPFTIPADAHTHYPIQGANAYGYFWIKLSLYEENTPFYADGAWLRAPKK